MSTSSIMYALIGLVAGVLGVLVPLLIKNASNKKTIRSAEQKAESIIQKAKSKSSKIEKDSKDRARQFEKKARRNSEEEIKKDKQKAKDLERTYNQKLEGLKKKEQSADDKFQNQLRKIEAKEKEIINREKRAESKVVELEDYKKQLQQKLESVGSYTQNQAKEELIKSMTDEAKTEFAQSLSKMEEEYKEVAEEKAKRIISIACARFAGAYAGENLTSTISLPNEEMKGKVIGKEGRNIRAFENMCGVDLILDEVPDAVVISAFDPVRREVARRTLTQLFEDGRIHPQMIEQTMRKVKKDLFKTIRIDGEKACDELGVTGLHKDIIDLIGSLKYRTSFSQNQYYHVIEVGTLCGMMAAELGEDVKTARTAGLLHDVGKALDHSMEGSHAIIGADFIKKRGVPEAIAHPVRAHHYEEEPSTILAHLVIAADAISGARPGARRSTQANYYKRLEDLETIANSFDGVTKTFAVQAGREVRVIVDSAKISDEHSVMLSKDIARKITREMKFPGQIKVTVVRETKAIEHAR